MGTEFPSATIPKPKLPIPPSRKTLLCKRSPCHLARLVSPPPDTEAVFVTPPGAFAAAVTVSSMAGYSCSGASDSLRMQVSSVSAQFHPAPARLSNVSPAGSVSVTVTLPDVPANPAFVTVTVYVAFRP